MFVTTLVLGKSIPEYSTEVDLINYLNLILNKECTKWYNTFKNCVDLNYITNLVKEDYDLELAKLQLIFGSTTLENARNFQQQLNDNGWIDFWNSNNVNATMSDIIEIDPDDLTDYLKLEQGHVMFEAISDVPNFMFDTQYPVV
jgi:hypothetical protein